MKILFVCTQNRLRSPTAERVFHGRAGIEARSAGTDRDATVPLSADLIAWADLVMVMENAHRNAVRRRFKTALAGRRLVTLHIADEYEFMDEALVRALEAAVWRYLPGSR